MKYEVHIRDHEQVEYKVEKVIVEGDRITQGYGDVNIELSGRAVFKAAREHVLYVMRVQ